jgi:hypothetical protein
LLINPNELRRRYAWLSDEALFEIDRTELIETAQGIYDEEVRRREARVHPGEEYDDAGDPDRYAIDVGPEPDWLEDAACALRISILPGVALAEEASQARFALRTAGIPCHIVTKPVEFWEEDSPPPRDYCVMVPGAVQLHAASVLDRAIFNSREEGNWRTHFEALTDRQLGALNPDIFCAGILDRAERLRSAYNDEVSKRNLKSRPASANR